MRSDVFRDEPRTEKRETILGSRVRRHWRVLFFALLAVAPFWSLHLAHEVFAPPGTTATGFIQGDQLYYLANARELVREGSWFLYKNPYDDAPSARRLYFQPQVTFWSLLLRLGLDPGNAYLLLLFGGGLATALIFWELLRETLRPSERFLVPMYFAGMWGGGILVLMGLGASLIEGGVIDWPRVIRYDPAEGWWFLNLGRNLVYATEAYYHALALGALLLAMRHRWRACLICMGVLVASTPFTGPQFAIIIAAWSLLASVGRWESRPPVWFTVCSVLFLSLAVFYYVVWLPRDPRHAVVFANLQLSWFLPKITIPFAYGIVGTFALHRVVSMLRARSFAAPGHVHLLLTVFFTSLALANHEIVTKPHQPIHFTRGYIWLPLFLIGAPSFRGLLENAFGRAQKAGSRFPKMVAMGICLLLPLDNAVWLVHQGSIARYGLFPARLNRSTRELYDAMESAGTSGVALMPSVIDYPAGTYTNVTPYTGHWLLTPDFRKRVSLRDQFYQRGDNSVLADKSIRVLVLPRTGPALKAISSSDWSLVCETWNFLVLKRR